MRVYLLLLPALFFKLIVYGQTAPLTFQENQSDSEKVVLLNEQASKFITLEPDSGIYFGELALKIGFRSKHFENLNKTHRILGWCFYQSQNFYKAKFHFQYALNDTSLDVFEKNKIYEALVNAAEKTSDYPLAYLFLKNSTLIKDSLNRQKQNDAIMQLQKQLVQKQEDSEDELKRKEKIWQMNKTRQQQLLVVAAVVVSTLLILSLVLFLLLQRNKKHFNAVLDEKNIVINATNDQNRKLQNELAGYEKLKDEIAKDKREHRLNNINDEEKPTVKPEAKKEQRSILDQFETASADERKKMIPRLESFVTIIPTQLQVIEQAFARHDWEMINNTLQTMKSIVHAAGLLQSETLINEINEHVNANATNRAVVKLLNVKSACTKTVKEIKKILEEQ